MSSFSSAGETDFPFLGNPVLGRYQGEGQIQYWETSHDEVAGSTYSGQCKVGFDIDWDSQNLALPFMSYTCSNSWDTGNDNPIYGQIIDQEIFFGSKKIGKIDSAGVLILEFSKRVIEYRDIIHQGFDCSETIQRQVPFEHNALLRISIQKIPPETFQIQREKSGKILKQSFANVNWHCPPVPKISSVDYWSRVSSTLNPR